jgi:peptide/nickel transport system permease protein
MGAYIVRRLIAMVLMLIALSMITFLLFNALPADPARLTCGKACTPQVIEANRHRLGLDKPLHEQYGAFVKGIFAGRTYGSGTQTFECDTPCLGYSFRKQAEVTDLIVDRLPVTGQLALGAFVLWIVVGVSVGVVAALKRGKWQGRTIMGAALTGYSFPSFFIALLLIFFVQLQLGWVPFVNYEPGMIVKDPVGWFQVFILPWTALAMLYAAFYARLTRNQMLETLGEDYIRTARAKGLPELRVLVRHALANAAVPIATVIGIGIAILIGGVVVTESVYAIPGLGRLTVDAVLARDYPTIQAVILLFSLVYVLINLAVDLVYTLLDPRIRY